jgi:uncharacterized hydrophobic protein (TIGR00271 family)
MDLVHVRIVLPPALTERTLELLTADRHVLNLVVMPASALGPGNDALECDVLKGAANHLLGGLRALGVDDAGAIAVDDIEVLFSRRADEIEADEPRLLVHAPLWSAVEANIRASGTYLPSFYLLLVIAGVIGAVGIMTNSQILVVAAMVVGPEYGAISSIALGLDRGNHRQVRAGTGALTLGFLLAIVVTLAFAGISRAASLQSKAFQLGVRPVSNLIDTPNAFSVVVAALAGIVGIVSLTEARGSALLGVFISVTTIPAASDVAVSIAFDQWHEAWGSLMQLLLNVMMLVIVGFLTLRLQRYIWGRVTRRASAASDG